MSRCVVTIGEVLVEIMATSVGYGFTEALDLVGPFPSGAPAIFADQLARQGCASALISCVGKDDFGQLNIDRLSRDGVDVSAITQTDAAVTGSAFVRYRPDGERDFIFNLALSANRYISLTDAARAVIEKSDHLHVVGSSLTAPAIAEIVSGALDTIKGRGGTVSFDPNVRKEVMAARGFEEQLTMVLARTDLLLPSGPELQFLADAKDEDAALGELLERGVAAIALKRGDKGARYRDATTDIVLPAFPVEEIDPTGAGDIFGATFVAGWLAGVAPEANLMRANAAGALAVKRRGPMEGSSSPGDIDAFLEGQPTLR